jgi:hypothetical protein
MDPVMVITETATSGDYSGGTSWADERTQTESGWIP